MSQVTWDDEPEDPSLDISTDLWGCLAAGFVYSWAVTMIFPE